MKYKKRIERLERRRKDYDRMVKEYQGTLNPHTCYHRPGSLNK